MTVEATLKLALQRQQAGELSQAEQLYRQVLAMQPNQPDALHLLGALAFQVGRFDAAVELVRRAIAVNPSVAAFHFTLGSALGKSGRSDLAIAAFRQSLKLRPDDPATHYNLGVALAETGQFQPAIDCYRQAVALDPGYVRAWNNLGDAFYETGQYEPAIDASRRALALSPNLVEAINTLGKSIQQTGRAEEAAAYYRQSLALRPDNADSYNNLGTLYHENGQIEQAIDFYRKALTLAPDNPEAHWNLGLMLLRNGDLEQGWPEYEWRWRVKKLGMKQPYPKPAWNGGQLNGRRLLLHPEQGLGDTIQFIRYLPRLARLDGNILVVCHVELLQLLKQIVGVQRWLTPGQMLPDFDVQCSLLSLPGIFKTGLTSIPATIPYLTAEVDKSDHWRRRLAEEKRLKVGLAWAGLPAHPNDDQRSLHLTRLASLAQVSRTRYFSLQKGPAAAQIKSSPIELTDWTDELKDFADTAALIANLDLVISVDTAVVHLAGAMGKPVWVLVPFAPDWRWMLKRTDSPWYPTMRLFRQPRREDWETPVNEVVEMLKEVRKV